MEKLFLVHAYLEAMLIRRNGMENNEVEKLKCLNVFFFKLNKLYLIIYLTTSNYTLNSSSLNRLIDSKGDFEFNNAS